MHIFSWSHLIMKKCKWNLSSSSVWSGFAQSKTSQGNQTNQLWLGWSYSVLDFNHFKEKIINQIGSDRFSSTFEPKLIFVQHGFLVWFIDSTVLSPSLHSFWKTQLGMNLPHLSNLTKSENKMKLQRWKCKKRNTKSKSN